MKDVTQFIVCLRGSERRKSKPRSIVDRLKEMPGIVIVGGDPLAGYEVLIPNDRVDHVKESLGTFAHIEVDEKLELT